MHTSHPPKKSIVQLVVTRERCEEFLAVRPLNDLEILAALNSVLSGTAKDWWKAVKKMVRTWDQFKAVFLRSVLLEDYEVEAKRWLRDRRKGPQESIRDFAFQYQALCLKWREDMTERDLLQAILQSLTDKSTEGDGHVVSREGISTEPGKVEVIQDFPQPQSVKEVQRFLGMAGWYHRFIPHFAERTAVLNALKKMKVTWAWSEECMKAFEDIKQALITTPVLISPDFSKPFQLQTDASEVGLSAVLSQEINEHEHVIAYASRLLRGAERN
ncbi:hypothetical protein SRHO_G00230890 [Serrasalmus rhombeus]